jgi:hypothetical protein
VFHQEDPAFAVIAVCYHLALQCPIIQFPAFFSVNMNESLLAKEPSLFAGWSDPLESLIGCKLSAKLVRNKI